MVDCGAIRMESLQQEVCSWKNQLRLATGADRFTSTALFTGGWTNRSQASVLMRAVLIHRLQADPDGSVPRISHLI